MQDWLGLAIVAISGLSGYTLGGIGSAALVFLLFPRLPNSLAVLIASLLAPLIVVILFGSIMLLDGSSLRLDSAMAAFAVLAGPGLVVGWPSAYLTLRGLERRVERAGVRAREIFE